MKLRNYQIATIEQTEAAIARLMSLMVILPTGGGKTVIFCSLVKKYWSEGKRILLIADREELIKQIQETLVAGYKIPTGIIMGKELPNRRARVQIASMQTIAARKKTMTLPDSDLVIIDEAHGAKADTYEYIINHYKKTEKTKILGFTATPVRLSGDGFSDLFEELLIPKVNGRDVDMQYLIEEGWLVPIRHLVCSVPDVSKVSVKGGEYVEKDMLEAMSTAPLVESYLKACEGGKHEKAIVFCVNVENSKDVAKRYNAAGIKAMHLDSNTSEETRLNAVKSFRRGEITVLTNVDLFGKGFDVPDVKIVQAGKMTKSLANYLQWVGRGTRPLKGLVDGFETAAERRAAIASSDKPYMIFLDHAGLFFEHRGGATTKRPWLEYFKRKKSQKEAKKRVVLAGRDGDGNLRIAQNIEEMAGLEMIEIPVDFLHIEKFLDLLDTARERGYKLMSVWYKYEEFLIRQNAVISLQMVQYVEKILLTENPKFKPENRIKPNSFYYIKQTYEKVFDREEAKKRLWNELCARPMIDAVKINDMVKSHLYPTFNFKEINDMMPNINAAVNKLRAIHNLPSVTIRL